MKKKRKTAEACRLVATVTLCAAALLLSGGAFYWLTTAAECRRAEVQIMQLYAIRTIETLSNGPSEDAHFSPRRGTGGDFL